MPLSVKWRGVSVGSGFYHQSTKIDFEITGDPITNAIPFRDQVVNTGSNPTEQAALGQFMDSLGYTAANPNANMDLTPTFNMGLDVSTFTIPMEASTAVSLLFGVINAFLGTIVRIQVSPNCFVIIAAMANANGTANPTNPR